jgi:hypothetical protein
MNRHTGGGQLPLASSLPNRECPRRGGKCQAEEEATDDVAGPMDIKIHTSKGHYTY